MAGAAAAPASDAQAHAGQSEKFDTAAVTTMSGGHFIHDVYPAFLGPLLPLLIEKHGLTLGAAGILLSVLRWSALIQPFLGVIADRQDARYWIILAPTVTALGMSLLGMAPNYLALVVLLTIAGLSHAAFHPAGGAQVTRFSGRNWGMGTSFWMAVVSAVGLENSWIAIGPAIVASLLLYWRIGTGQRLRLGSRPPNLLLAVHQAGRPLSIVAGIIILRSLGSASFPFFFPTYVVDVVGGTLAFAALAITVFELAGAAGAFSGGTLSDRFGRRTVLALSTAITGPLLFLVFMVPDGWPQLAILVVAGLTGFAGAPVQMVLVQELLPDNRSSAMGLMMLLGLIGTILATVAVGYIADVIGLGPTLSTTMLLSVLPLPLVLLLPETRHGHDS
jgi:MFS transporter, FSR family, fosmidomycin resistance protein